MATTAIPSSPIQQTLDAFYQRKMNRLDVDADRKQVMKR